MIGQNMSYTLLTSSMLKSHIHYRCYLLTTANFFQCLLLGNYTVQSRFAWAITDMDGSWVCYYAIINGWQKITRDNATWMSQINKGENVTSSQHTARFCNWGGRIQHVFVSWPVICFATLTIFDNLCFLTNTRTM